MGQHQQASTRGLHTTLHRDTHGDAPLGEQENGNASKGNCSSIAAGQPMRSRRQRKLHWTRLVEQQAREQLVAFNAPAPPLRRLSPLAAARARALRQAVSSVPTTCKVPWVRQRILPRYHAPHNPRQRACWGEDAALDGIDCFDVNAASVLDWHAALAYWQDHRVSPSEGHQAHTGVTSFLPEESLVTLA